MTTSRSASPIVRGLVLLTVAILLTAALRAQMPSSSSTTSTPVPGVGHDYLGAIAETVNPANGSVSIRITATMPPGRGLTLPFSFAYDSNGVNYVTPSVGGGLAWEIPSSTIVSTGGWSESVPVVSANYLAWTATREGGSREACYAYVNYVYQDASGNRHDLNLTNFKGNAQDDACTYDTAHWPAGFGGVAVTQAGEGGWSTQPGAQPVGAIIASIPQGNPAGMPVGPVSVTEPDGTTFYFTSVANNDVNGALPSSVEDRNGNIIQITPAGTSGYNYADTLGRAVLQDSGFATSGETVTILGLNAPYNLQWTTLPTPSFQAAVTTVLGVCPQYFPHVAWYNTITDAPITGISTLTLPNGKSFSFTYDSTYKVVNKVTYPTGGYVRYVWGMNAQAEFGTSQLAQNPQCDALYAVPVITDRYVSFNGSTEVLHQHFAYTTNWNTSGAVYWTSKTTAVTTTDNVRSTSYNTVYTYSRSGAIPPPNTASAPTGWDPVENSIAYYDTSGNLLKTVYETWANPRLLLSQETQYAIGSNPNGPANETTWSYNSREQQIERQDYDFGTSGVGSLLRKTITNYQEFNDTPLYANAASIVDSPCQVITYDSTGTNRVAETDYFYDNGPTTTPCGAAGTPSVAGAGGSSLTGHDETNYSASSTNPRGNLTQRTQWLNTGTSPFSTYAYDETGQVGSVTDPKGTTTTYSFADSYLNTNSSGFTTTAGSPPSGMVTNAYLTKVTYPTTNGVAHIEKFSYGYNDGELTQSSDQNSPPQLTTYKYNDSLGRFTETDYPDTGQTLVTFNDAVPSVTTCQNINGTAGATCSATSPATGWKTMLLTMDGLAHPAQTELASDPSGPTYTATVYDGSGRKFQTYNPTRCSSIITNCASETTWGYTATNYDGLGRVTSVVEPDQSVVTTTYDQTNANSPGLCTTVTDEVGNSRQSCADGLGRLTSVWEAPTTYNFETVYAYDALNNLLSVAQEGGSISSNWRSRSFVYDSVSRLTSASNPESGTIAYAYDLNGNVASKTTPLENQTGTGTVQTAYAYDALNRLTKKSYSDNFTPTVQFAYDAGTLSGCTEAPPALTDTYPIGRRTSMCDGSGGTSWSHDQLGRILIPRRQVASASPRELTYLYNLDGSLAKQTDGSGGKVITYTTGGAGLPLAAEDASGNMFVKSAAYAPFGGLTSMINGYTSSFAGITTSNQYNSRLQPILLSAGVSGQNPVFSECFDFHLGAAITAPAPCSFAKSTLGDNGNVYQIVNNVNNARTQNFTYDPLNRILTAASQATSGTYCWGQNFALGIDAWGNLNQITASQCSAPSLTQTSNTKNQIVGFCYDAAGNLLDEIACPPNNHTFVYNAEGQLLYTAGYSYLYDGDGQRVAKCTSTGQSSTCPTSSTGTIYLRNLGNESALETDLSGNVQNEYIFFNGNRLVRSDSSSALHYYFHNHLATTEVVTNAVGSTPPQQDVDYTPYGIVIDGTPSEHYLFTGKERDAESGLDNFGARYNGSSLGRFMTPDWAAKPTNVPYASFGNPQSLNLYSYVNNNPTTTRDPDGHSDAGTFCNTQCRYGTPVSSTEIQIDIGVLELGSAVATGGATLEAMAAGAALKTALGAIATAGLGVSGTTRIIATAAGEKSENVEEGTTAVTTLTTPAGMAVTLGTGGNLKAGAVASDLTSAATAVKNPVEAAKDPAGTALTVGNVVQDVKAGYNAVRSLVSPPPPPAPPTPPPPPRCTSGDQCH